MHHDIRAEIGRLPQRAPSFNTERFIVAPLAPPKLRELASILLQDEWLAASVPWVQDKSADGALKEGFLLELQATTRSVIGWAIVERARRMVVGTVLARQAVGGIDLEVLCPSAFWDQGVSEEVGAVVSEWLEDHAEVDLVLTQ